LKWRGLQIPCLYDPSAKEKKTWKNALKDALSELGIIAGEVPVFGEAGYVEPIQVKLTFTWPQPG
jgi:hypothetical protein